MLVLYYFDALIIVQEHLQILFFIQRLRGLSLSVLCGLRFRCAYDIQGQVVCSSLLSVAGKSEHTCVSKLHWSADSG